MSRQQYQIHRPDDFFSHQTLEQTILLLRNNNPGLASAIQHALSQIHVTSRRKNAGIENDAMHFNAEIFESLNAHTIGKIVVALTELGDKALNQHNLLPAQMNNLRKLIDDWVLLTEWILRQTHSDKANLH